MLKPKPIKKILPSIFSLLIFVIIVCSAFCFPPQPIMWGHTGSPGETTCTSCHGSYPLNPPHGGNVQIILMPAITNNEYIPNQTYTINIVVTHATDSVFAFDFEALDSLGQNIGTSIITDSVHTKKIIYTVNNRENIFFANLGNGLNSFTFKFNWVAPSSGIVNFYATGLVSNMNGMTSGDYVYSDSLINLKPLNTSSILNFLLLQDVKIYPNPANSTISIEVNKADNIKQIIVSDILGKKLIEINPNSLGHQQNIDVSKLTSGEYNIRIKTEVGIINKKILKR